VGRGWFSVGISWLSGKEIVISPKDIDRISYEESKVFVNPDFRTSSAFTSADGRVGANEVRCG
jgi:hypothetical protein